MFIKTVTFDGSWKENLYKSKEDRRRYVHQSYTVSSSGEMETNQKHMLSAIFVQLRHTAFLIMIILIDLFIQYLFISWVSNKTYNAMRRTVVVNTCKTELPSYVLYKLFINNYYVNNHVCLTPAIVSTVPFLNRSIINHFYCPIYLFAVHSRAALTYFLSLEVWNRFFLQMQSSSLSKNP